MFSLHAKKEDHESSEMRLLLLLTLSCGIGESLETDKVMEFRTFTTCTYRNPKNPIGLSPVRYDVDVISVKFSEIFKEKKCNKNKALIKKYYPKVQYREVGKEAWKKTEPEEGKNEFAFENLNPCATYEVRVEPYNNLQVRTFTVGPYYDDPTVDDPIIDDDNEEYKKSFRTMRTTQKATSAQFNLTICAKLLQLVVEPEKEKGQFKKSDLVQLNPRNRGATIVSVKNLKPCTKFVVHAELSLKNQTNREFVNDYDKYEREDITKFWTLPNIRSLEKHLHYEETEHLLSWDFSSYFEQECAEPMKKQNPKFVLKIGSNMTTVTKVRLVLQCSDVEA